MAGAIIVLVIVLVIVGVALTLPRADRLATISLFVTSASILLASLVLRPDWFAFPDIGFVGGEVLFNGRYMSVAGLCLAMVVVMAIDRAAARSSKAARARRVALVGFAVLAGLLVVNIPVELFRPPRSSWDRELTSGQAECAAHGNDGIVAVHSGPFSTPDGGFQLVLTCREAFG